MLHRRITTLVALFLLAGAGALGAQGAGMKPDQATLVKVALAAAPATIAEYATVKDWDGTTLKEGSNGWVCFPDVPSSPGTDAMCLDATWQAWAQAWQNHAQPNVQSVGLAYMLSGGSDASNTDPFATAPAEGHEWIDSGPHIMILLPDMSRADNLSTDPESGGPYVMWKGTPYAHIMMPVASRAHMEGMKDMMKMDKDKEMKDKEMKDKKN